MKVMGRTLGDKVKFLNESGKIETGIIDGFIYIGDKKLWQAVIQTPSGSEEVAVFNLKDN